MTTPDLSWEGGCEIKQSPDKGRYQVSTRSFEKGDIVMITHAYSYALMDSYKKRVCDWCLAYNTTGIFSFNCSQCSQTWYCSSSCLESSADYHRHLCQHLKKISNWKHDRDFLCLLTLALITYLRLHQILPPTIPLRHTSTVTQRSDRLPDWAQIYQDRWDPKDEDLTALIHHIESWEEEELKDWNSGARKIQTLLRTDRDLVDEKQEEKELVEIILRGLANNFGLWTPAKDSKGLRGEKCYGRAFFPLASFFNHSCDPNCYVEESGVTLAVFAAKKISPGEELNIKYIDINLPRSARQHELWVDYRFLCGCVRCSAEEGINLPTKLTYHEKGRGRGGVKPSKNQKKKKKEKEKLKQVSSSQVEDGEDRGTSQKKVGLD
eukprot:TRINITY_DN18102_c0_g1_i1.p1 TRINITY_DN18102_c0_g1~~TRINITY_DN18102_c0_g1_i1.p1  ORF type:complete len:379 (-),score=44.93 TRINITY_DN18102_c0_g1_i1:56-1192(-)